MFTFCGYMYIAATDSDDASTATSVSSDPAIGTKASFVVAWVFAGVFLVLMVVFSLVSVTMCYLKYNDILGFKTERTGEPKVTSK